MSYTHLVHAFAPASGGIHVWVEQVDGHSVVLDPRTLDRTSLPHELFELVISRPMRRRGMHTLASPKGRIVEIQVPTLAFTPQESVALMTALCSYINTAATESEGKTPEEIGLSPEILYLCDLFAFADSLVRSGRIMFRTDLVERTWYPRWVVSAAGDHHRVIERFERVLPGVLSRNGTDVHAVLDDFIHWIAVEHLGRAQGLHEDLSVEFVEALATGTESSRVSSRTMEALAEWRRSAARKATELTLMLSSPQDTVENMEKRHWRLGFALSTNGGPVTPLVAAETPEQTRTMVARFVDDLVKAWPELRPALDAVYVWAQPGWWIPGPDIVTGDPLRDRMVAIGLTLDQVAELLDTRAAELKSRGINVMIPREWIAQRPSVRIRTTAVGDGPGSGKLGLDQLMNFSVSISLNGQAVDERVAREMVNSASSIVKINGKYVHLDQTTLRRARQWMDVLKESAKERSGQQDLAAVTVRDVLEANAASQDDREDEHEFTVITDGWVDQLLTHDNRVEPPQNIELPETVVTPLREHQLRGVKWLAWMLQHNLGAILADDMGLGKTLQILALVAWEKAHRAEEGQASVTTLVIAPTSVLNAWVSEARTHVPSLKILVDHGPRAPESLAMYEQAPEEAPDIVLTTYGRVARNPERYRGQRWGRVVADEAQAIKNPNTKQSRAVRSIDAYHHIALSGTPVENKLADLYALMDFANPGILGSAPAFQNRLAIPIERYQDPDATARLRNLVQPFILRRLKTDEEVGLDLPPKQEIVETIALTAEQAALYEAYISRLEEDMHRGTTGRRAMILGALVRIKQICNHPVHFTQDGSGILKDGKHRSHRVERIFEILEQARTDGRKALLFTQFPTFGSLLIPEMEQHFGMKIPMLHGGLTRAQRARMVEDFQSPDGPQFMVLSVKAGGTGITLTEASVVIHIDRWWNPAVEDQATDRAYRIGQNKDVTVYKLVAQGTLDERINDLIMGKRELASTVVGAGEGWIADLSDAELSELWTLRTGSDEPLHRFKRGGEDSGH
ncbi:DEAD/DEAH box helicase [Corynebacterium sp. 320]|uniref:DEAD/DEAH box helicase n=1 Tax=Corynebacterium TaxID=1716 RepID=UPI00125CAB1D|nr:MULTISPECIES: DEAD/DEAH box helicase [Corynebacterium]KAB1503953.1 DEAD/DEAH box helicase [Corynebacterium sp. 320]KAB1552948.1 DEAD/DEAH box helicase [Corynebacterium sp. 321]KAB1553832.1 DEAD/DEAH box helicase [Corynebacterium sp. 319]KAB3528089.1 DEAD/DEAH box helicase [Corynebacterium sp. 250]KAB3540423.1 DEAD/DEAH box helicase [Corynebacterium sp. 366]